MTELHWAYFYNQKDKKKQSLEKMKIYFLNFVLVKVNFETNFVDRINCNLLVEL